MQHSSVRLALALSLLVASPFAIPFAAFARPHHPQRAAQTPPRANVAPGPTPVVDEPVWTNSAAADAADAGVAAPDADAILRAVQRRYAGVVEFEADFERFDTDLAQQVTTVSRGHVQLGARARMRWESTDGSQTITVSDGNAVTEHQRSLNRAYVSPVRRSALAMAVAFVTESRDLRADFTASVLVSPMPQFRDRRMLSLEPREPNAPFTRLLLSLDTQSDDVVGLAIVHGPQRRERYRFDARQLRKSATLSPARYSLSLPPGTTVIQRFSAPIATPITPPITTHTSPQSVRTSSRTGRGRSP